MPTSESHRAKGVKAREKTREIVIVDIMAASEARRPSLGESIARAHAKVAKTSVRAESMKSVCGLSLSLTLLNERP